MGTVKLKDFRPAVMALQTKALANLRDVSQGKMHSSYWGVFSDQLMESARLLRAIDANPDAAIASLSSPQPEGEWVMVPRDAIERAIETLENDGDEHGEGRNLRAMLDAAQQPPAEAQPVAYADPQAFANFKERGHLGGPHGREWMWAKPDAGLVPVYAHPPPSAPVGVEAFVVRDYIGDDGPSIKGNGFDGLRIGEDRYEAEEFIRWVNARLAPQPAADFDAWQQNPYTKVLMKSIDEEYVPKHDQQPAAVDEAMVERIAALLHEEATDEPWTVAGVEHEGPDRDYYRKLARKVLTLAAQQPAAVGEVAELVGLLDEVRSHFTRDDDLPDDLLPRIDAALAQQPAADLAWCALDRDECTVTLAFDTEEQVDEFVAIRQSRKRARTVDEQPAAVDGLNVWRAAFIAERSARYREDGMGIEQAHIHAETDAARIAARAALRGGSDNG